MNRIEDTGSNNWRKFVTNVSFIVHAQSATMCSCKFSETDEFGEFMTYRPHSLWEVWQQNHSSWGWDYFLKCRGCGYELARNYWWVHENGKRFFVDYRNTKEVRLTEGQLDKEKVNELVSYKPSHKYSKTGHYIVEDK